MPENVTIPISFFEAVIELERPNLRLWSDRVNVVQALFDAFGKWNIGVDDIEVVTVGKPSEQGVKFRLREKRVTFFFNAASCTFSRDNTSWDTAQETIEILDAALTAFIDAGNVKPALFKIDVGLHVQPMNLKFMTVLERLIPAPMASLDPLPVQTMASVLKWANRRVTIDGSGQIANALFIRFQREFKADVSYQEIARQLKQDEDGIFSMLDIQEGTDA